LRTPCGALEKLTVVNQPKDFDGAVGSEPIEDQVPWFLDLVLPRDQASGVPQVERTDTFDSGDRAVAGQGRRVANRPQGGKY
jgi:hypothetical protein